MRVSLVDPCMTKSDHFRNMFFFHEYGRRVGMVPRSSLKGGKNSLMVEKITRTTNTTQKPQQKAQSRVTTIM